MTSRYIPRRRLRSDILSLAFVALVPAVLLSVFPYVALRPPPPVPANGGAAPFAFVRLSPAEERQALKAARVAWRIDRRSGTGPICLYADVLPADRPRAVLDLTHFRCPDRAAPDPYVPDMLPRTLAAPPPVRIAPQDGVSAATPAFPREELLRLN